VARAKVAAALRLAVGYDRPGPIRDPETVRQAWRELRALLAVVRAAAAWADAPGYRHSDMDRLINALARLRRSGGAGRAR
jgi:hypothetical protein